MITLLKQAMGICCLAIPFVSQAAAPEPRWDRNPVYNGPVINVNAAPAAKAADPYNAPPSPSFDNPVPRYTAPSDPESDPHQRGLSLGGPRFGMSYINGGGYDKMKEAVAKAKPGTEVDPFMTQFGWQVEYRMFRTSGGITALTELVPLVGGMDQGLALPSLTWLVGLRGKKGFEMGVGPNVGLNGVAMMLAAGYTFDLGGINLPINVAVGRGANQTTSTGLSIGFNL